MNNPGYTVRSYMMKRIQKKILLSIFIPLLFLALVVGLRGKVFFIVPILLLATVVGQDIYQKMQYHRAIKALTLMDPQTISTFRVYPTVYRPVGTCRDFTLPDPLIKEFFQSLRDLRSYRPSGETAVSQAHRWFLEVTTKHVSIQIGCIIPSEKDDLVVGTIGKFSNRIILTYGYFQSQNLFQWYQTYKHRWLTPAAGENEE